MFLCRRPRAGLALIYVASVRLVISAAARGVATLATACRRGGRISRATATPPYRPFACSQHTAQSIMPSNRELVHVRRTLQIARRAPRTKTAICVPPIGFVSCRAAKWETKCRGVPPRIPSSQARQRETIEGVSQCLQCIASQCRHCRQRPPNDDEAHRDRRHTNPAYT